MGKKHLLVHIKWGDSIPIRQGKYIKNTLDKIIGVKESFFTEGSEISNIAALTEWDEYEIEQKLSEIRKIPHVTSVDYRILIPA